MSVCINNREPSNDVNLSTDTTAVREAGLQMLETQECAKTEFSAYHRNVHWAQKSLTSLLAMIFSSAQPGPFLSFGRSLTKHRLQLYFQKALLTLVLALQII